MKTTQGAGPNHIMSTTQVLLGCFHSYPRLKLTFTIIEKELFILFLFDPGYLTAPVNPPPDMYLILNMLK